MENSLLESILQACRILNKHSVEYLVVGGTAVALHGHYRQTHDAAGRLTTQYDLDFWYNPTYDNYFRLLNALEEFGIDVREFRAETTPNPKRSFFRKEWPTFKLDFLPEILGLAKFRSSFNERIVATFDDVIVPYISYNDLIKSKLVLGRPKDLEDIDQLKFKKDNPEA